MVISAGSGSLELKVYEALTEAILGGELKAGEPLTELGLYAERIGEALHNEKSHTASFRSVPRRKHRSHCLV